MYLYDYHSHSNFSMDGKDSIAKLCAAAIAAGLQELAITDHFEPTPLDEESSNYKADEYFSAMKKMRSLYKGSLKLKYAVEMGQPHHYAASSEKLLAAHPYDYVLASVHMLPTGEDLGYIAYSKENISFYTQSYLDELKGLAKWNKFDCVGHFDLLKRYAIMRGVETDFMAYQEQIEEILRIIIANGKGIEINTSGLRQESKECLPGLDILKIYKQLGGEIITIGSDAHFAKDVGKGVKEAIELLKTAGFKYVTVYSQRQPEMIKISGRPSAYAKGIQTA
jgi:histidinol-phosphatase (PHP family)